MTRLRCLCLVLGCCAALFCLVRLSEARHATNQHELALTASIWSEPAPTPTPRPHWDEPSFWKRKGNRSLTNFLSQQIEEQATAHFGIGRGVLDGRSLFVHQWKRDDVLAGDGDGLGPVCNANSCSACHFKGGLGGAGDVKAVMSEIGLNTPSLFGAGVIDQISDAAIANSIWNYAHINEHSGRIGKFGWGGEFVSLRDFVGTAAAVEVGLSNELHRQDLPGREQSDTSAAHDLSSKQLDNLVAFCRSLPRPKQILPTHYQARARVNNGEKVFERIGCAKCHTPKLDGVDGIYTDFGLYRLEDSTEHYNYNYTEPWKTPALWGVADSAPYWHNGSAPTLLSAIEKHGGDAVSSRSFFRMANKQDRDDLITFLKTLRAPKIAEPCPPNLRGTVVIAPGGLMCY